MKKYAAAILLLFTTGICVAQNAQRISVHQKTQTLNNQKISRSEADLYFEFPEGKMILYNLFPEEYVFLSNPLGEARIYYPKKNQVVIRTDELLNSQNNSLYQFLTNQTYDLGLQTLGFSLVENHEEEGGFFISTWQAPALLKNQVNQIKLVHENMIPVHCEYLDQAGKPLLKVYYDNFQTIAGSSTPGLVTEIVFLPDGDSIIKRMQYSDFRYGGAVDKSKFEFTIPEDAKVIK